jgi:hypothetical protein
MGGFSGSFSTTGFCRFSRKIPVAEDFRHSYGISGSFSTAGFRLSVINELCEKP